jgi:hypothetical protein
MTACLFLLSRTAIVRSWTSCALVVTPLLACVPALGASQADYNQCLQNVDQDRRIAGCTRVIDDAGESNRNRQLAYDNRVMPADLSATKLAGCQLASGLLYTTSSKIGFGSIPSLD